MTTEKHVYRGKPAGQCTLLCLAALSSLLTSPSSYGYSLDAVAEEVLCLHGKTVHCRSDALHEPASPLRMEGVNLPSNASRQDRALQRQLVRIGVYQRKDGNLAYLPREEPSVRRAVERGEIEFSTYPLEEIEVSGGVIVLPLPNR